MLRRVLGIALILGVSLFALYQIRQSLRSPEERLHYRVARMVRDFNEGHTRAVARAFHPNFVDASSGASRERLQQGLYALRWEYSRDGEFLLEFQWTEPFEPEVDATRGIARGSGQFRIVDHRFDPERVWWESPVELEFVYDGSRWALTKAEQTTGHPTR